MKIPNAKIGAESKRALCVWLGDSEIDHWVPRWVIAREQRKLPVGWTGELDIADWFHKKYFSLPATLSEEQHAARKIEIALRRE